MNHAHSLRTRSPIGTDAPPILPPASRLLIDVRQVRHETVEFPDNAFFNDLCGTVVEGEIILAAGAPGSNKSTVARQLILDRAVHGIPALQILTEEPPERMRSAMLTMASDMPSSKVREALSNIHVETGIHDVQMLPNFFASHVLSPHGPYHGVKMIVLDSIQGPGLSANNFDAYQALIQFFQLARASKILVIAICHITKRGEIAGPKALEHSVDCSILIRKAYNRRVVSVLKNRFGPETARPMQLEIDPVLLKLRPSPHAETLTAVARGYLHGAGETEVQGAVTLPKPGTSAKVTAPGLPRKEIEQYVAGLCQVPGFELADFDLSIQCRVPGERRYRSVLGLPLSLALAASYIQQPIPENQLHIGEIDLCRNVRDVPGALLNDLSNSIVGSQIKLPVRILCPPSAASQLPSGHGVEIVQCRKLDDAIFATWPNLR